MTALETALEEGLPAPGEPLKPKIHEDNQKLLDAELAARAERARSKLTRGQLRQLDKRYRKLWKKLNRAKFNELIRARWDLLQEFRRLKHAFKQASDRKAQRPIVLQAREIQRQGRQLDARLAPLQPLAAEFDSIVKRLKAHQDVLAWEQEDAENKAEFKREARVWQAQMEAVFRQTAHLHHAGEDSKGRSFIRIPKIEQILFKEDRVLYQIATTKQSPLGRMFGRWYSALPYDVDIKDLTCEETLENLTAGCGRIVTVERSKTGTNIFYCISRMDSPDGIPKKQLYSKVLNWYPVADHAKTPWAAGVSEDRKIKFYNFEDSPHILIAGSTKSGKSNHVNQMIAMLASMNTPDEVRFVLIDNKGGIEFTHWKTLKHLLRPMIKNVDQVLDTLKYVRGLMERRLATFEAIGAKNISSYNQKVAKKLPRIITIIDEMATLQGLGDLTAEIQNELGVLAAQGRAVGVHLVVCTQHVSVQVIPGWAKTNMGLRISGKMPNHMASMVILDSVTAAALPNVPGRMVFREGGYEIVAQSPYISDEEVARTVALSREMPDPDDTEYRDYEASKPVKAPKPKFSEEDAIEMALTMFDGQLAPSKIFKQIGPEVMSERDVKSLVNDILERAALNDGIVHSGMVYKPRKIRKTHVLEAVGPAVEQLAGQEADTSEASYSPSEESEVEAA